MLVGWIRRWRPTGDRGDPDPVAFQARLSRAFGVDPRRYAPAALHADFQDVFGRDARGRRVLYKILEWGHLYQPSFQGGDPHGTAFRDGERNLALRIFAVLNAETGVASEKADTDGPAAD